MRQQHKKQHGPRRERTQVLVSEQGNGHVEQSNELASVALTSDEVRMVSYIRRDAVRVVLALALVALLFVATDVALRRSKFISGLGERMAVAAGLKTQ